MSDNSEALRLADALDERVVPRWVHSTGQTPQQKGYTPDAKCVAAAAELRLLHSANEQLRSQNTELDAACAKLEAENCVLRSTQAELVEALRPFAEADLRRQGIQQAFAEAVMRARAALAKVEKQK